MSTTILYVPKSRHPELIGRGGSNLKDWQTKFKVKITVPNRDEKSSEIIVSGKAEDVVATREEIEKVLGIKTSQPHLTCKLDIATNNYSRLIGTGGSTMKGLQDTHHVRINVPRQGSKEEYVTVEGQENDINDLITALETLLKTEVKKVEAGASPPSPTTAPAVNTPIWRGKGVINKVIFFPDTDKEFLGYLGSASKSLDICVFTITDDRIAAAIKKSKAHGVHVRIITDNDQSVQLGSDIEELKKSGIEVKMDTSPYHMHHKFAVLDNELLINGSFNWTKGASTDNCENIMITNNADFVSQFSNHFEFMWKDTTNFK